MVNNRERKEELVKYIEFLNKIEGDSNIDVFEQLSEAIDKLHKLMMDDKSWDKY